MRVNVGDVELYVRAEGAGRPLVLLHGGPGLDGSVFFPALSPLADEGVRLLAVDHRANGRSDAGDPARWTVPQMADDVEALIARARTRAADRDGALVRHLRRPAAHGRARHARPATS